jgi:hypothetical protein
MLCLTTLWAAHNGGDVSQGHIIKADGEVEVLLQ